MQEYINPGTPLKLVKTETFRPDCRPGATFAEADGKYSITLDEKTGCFGKWIFSYDLPAEVTACRFAVRHDAGKAALAKLLPVAVALWLDANGHPVRSAYLEADSETAFSRVLRRPDDAVGVALTVGIRYLYGQTVTYSDISCTPVEMPRRPVRIVTAKIAQNYQDATVASNVARMESVFQKLADAGEKPDLVVFPETMPTRSVRTLGVDKGAQPIPGPHTDWAAGWARKLHTNVVVSLREIKDGHYFNSAAVIDRQGNIVGVYHKTQLTIGEYEEGYDWGDDLPVFDLDFGRIGVLICWDMWFPEAIRTLRLRGAEVIAYPIAATSRIHYDNMWRSRARENGVVLVTSISGSSGTCPSRILTADGEVQSETYIGQTYAAATVDLSDQPTYLRYLSVSYGAGESRTFYTFERHPELYRDLDDLD